MMLSVGAIFGYVVGQVTGQGGGNDNELQSETIHESEATKAVVLIQPS